MHTAPKRHLIKIRTFLTKINSYLEKYEFARRFEGLKTWPNFLKFCTAIKNLTNFLTANLKLLLSIQILCASHFKFVWKYPPPGFKTLEFQNFFFYSTSTTQTIYCNKKLHTLSRFATLRAISNLFSFFLYTLYSREFSIANVCIYCKLTEFFLLTITGMGCMNTVLLTIAF